MTTREKKDDLERVRARVDKKIERRKERARELGNDDSRKATDARSIGDWSFHAARFQEAVACWRTHWQLKRRMHEVSVAEEAAKANSGSWLSRLLRRSPPPAPPASADPDDFGLHLSDFMHRDAWRVDRLDLMGRQLERQAAGSRAMSINALDWRLARVEPPAPWWAATRQYWEKVRNDKKSERGDTVAWQVHQAIEVDLPLARGLFWLGETAEAHELLGRVIEATAPWHAGEEQMWSDETPDVRAAYGGTVHALHELSRPDGSGASEAVRHVRAALLCSLRTGDESRHEELPFIHVVALARHAPQDAVVTEFRTHLPWLAHLIE